MASNANEKDFTAFSSNNNAYACENIHQSADDPIACLSQAWGRRSKIKAKMPRWLPEAAAHFQLGCVQSLICFSLFLSSPLLAHGAP